MEGETSMSRPEKGRETTNPGWKTRWPRNGDLREWLLCMISKARAIDNVNDRVTQAMIAIEELAKRSSDADVLNYLEQIIRTLPKNDGLALVRALEAGADLSLESGDMKGVDRYLDRILATKPLHTRPCDKGFEVGVVKKFKALHGLLDPAEAKDERQRLEASVNACRRRADAAIADKLPDVAVGELRAAEGFILEMEKCQQGHAMLDLAKRYAKLGALDDLRRWVDRIDKSDVEDILDGRELWGLGLADEAVARTESDIQSALETLAAATDPNVHHTAYQIERLISFLIQIGREALASKRLERALEEGKAWCLGERGFASAGLLRSLAKLVAKLHGPEAAGELMSLAMQDAKGEGRSEWRAGAVQETIELHSQLGQTEKAIKMASKLRSATERRRALAPLLAKAQRWKELREVLCQVQTPLEAAQLCWKIKFALTDTGR
jgi:hypothetical protein